MTSEVQDILQSFELLCDAEKRELAAEIVRRSLNLDASPLSDEQLVFTAEERFLELDRNEAEAA